MDARAAGLGLTSIQEINTLPREMAEALYLRLVPGELLRRLEISPSTLCRPDGARLVRITAPEERPWARVEVRAAPGDRDPMLLMDVEMSAMSVPELAFVQINDPDAPRYGIDRDAGGRDTLFGTASRNLDEEARAMRDGLAPGQVRRGLGMLARVLQCMEAFCGIIGKDLYLIDPLFYHSAVLYERRGCGYIMGREIMELLHEQFSQTGALTRGPRRRHAVPRPRGRTHRARPELGASRRRVGPCLGRRQDVQGDRPPCGREHLPRRTILAGICRRRRSPSTPACASRCRASPPRSRCPRPHTGAGPSTREPGRERVMHTVVVHYHEISLKRGNRPLFLRRLQDNLLRAVGDLGSARVEQLPGRIVLRLDGDSRRRRHRRPDRPRLRRGQLRPRRADVSGHGRAEAGGGSRHRGPALRVLPHHRTTGLQDHAAVVAGDESRAGGPRARARHPARVSLEHPELNVHVEVLPGQAFVYADRRPGPGGLPVGSSGMVAALLSGGIDSPVAAWRLMKRGCRVTFVHFHSVPYLPDISRGKARALVERLTAWQYVSRLFLVPFGEIQRAVVLAVPGPLRVVVYRRLMLRIAEVIGRSSGALALVTGESVGQVASQTLHNLARVDEVADMPVLRPLIGMDKLEITAQAEAIEHLRDLHRAGCRLLHAFRAEEPRHACEPRGDRRRGEPAGRRRPGGDGRDGCRARDLRLPRGRGPHATAPRRGYAGRGGAGRR